MKWFPQHFVASQWLRVFSNFLNSCLAFRNTSLRMVTSLYFQPYRSQYSQAKKGLWSRPYQSVLIKLGARLDPSDNVILSLNYTCHTQSYSADGDHLIERGHLDKTWLSYIIEFSYYRFLVKSSCWVHSQTLVQECELSLQLILIFPIIYG